MHVVVIRSPIRQLVDQRRIRVEVEDHRLVLCKDRVEVSIRQSMRMLRGLIIASPPIGIHFLYLIDRQRPH